MRRASGCRPAAQASPTNPAPRRDRRTSCAPRPPGPWPAAEPHSGGGHAQWPEAPGPTRPGRRGSPGPRWFSSVEGRPPPSPPSPRGPRPAPRRRPRSAPALLRVRRRSAQGAGPRLLREGAEGPRGRSARHPAEQPGGRLPSYLPVKMTRAPPVLSRMIGACSPVGTESKIGKAVYSSVSLRLLTRRPAKAARTAAPQDPRTEAPGSCLFFLPRVRRRVGGGGVRARRCPRGPGGSRASSA